MRLGCARHAARVVPSKDRDERQGNPRRRRSVRRLSPRTARAATADRRTNRRADWRARVATRPRRRPRRAATRNATAATNPTLARARRRPRARRATRTRRRDRTRTSMARASRAIARTDRKGSPVRLRARHSPARHSIFAPSNASRSHVASWCLNQLSSISVRSGMSSVCFRSHSLRTISSRRRKTWCSLR